MSDNTILGILLGLTLLFNIIESRRTGRILFRHQKALEWFRKHVNLDPENLPDDAPKDLLESLEKEADKKPR